MRSFEELSRRISGVSDVLVRVLYLRYLSLWFQSAAEKVCFSSTNLETGTDETIRIMPCVMMYQSKEASRLEETTPRRILKRSRVCMF